jgi:hypothetical protein
MARQNQGSQTTGIGSSPWVGTREGLAWRLVLRVAGTVGALLRRALGAAAERERGQNEAGEGERVRARLKRELEDMGRRRD